MTRVRMSGAWPTTRVFGYNRGMLGGLRSLGVVCAFAAVLPLVGCGGESTRSRRGDDSGEGAEGGDGNSNPANPGGGGSSTIGNFTVSELRTKGIDKVDLLFMIDNSISMADKQRLLAEAVPLLFLRLAQPVCTNAQGEVVGTQPCAGGSAPEFRAIENIHIGVVTSSLGHHGSYDVCSDETGGRTPDDHAELLPSVRPSSNPPLTSWNNLGFLVWDPRGNDPTVDDAHAPPGWGSPGGPGDAQGLVTAFANQVRAAGELGCGYEQQLESWYRFLVDPEPVQSMDNDGVNGVRVGVNEVVLTQREAFLRRDSLLAIVMLTDENDCSIVDEDGSQGWLVGYKGGASVNNWRMPASTYSCKLNPNDPCCRPCIVGPKAGCGDNAAEGCPAGDYLSLAEDSMNQRCFNQMQRFGIDLLYPTNRYVDAITSNVIDPRMNGDEVPNPLFAPGPLGEPARERGLVFLAGIVGVPWQDIATDGAVPVADGKFQPPNSLTDPRALVFLSASELESMNRWDVILGEPSEDPPVPPADALMIESIDPRPAGMPHPFLPGAAIAAPGGSASNSINGREQAVDPATRDDLQFACIFPLVDPVSCDASNAAGCDCNADEAIKQSPLCEYSSPGADGRQVNAKAYPSVRELQVLRGVGDAGIVASICPKNVAPQGGSPSADPYYGYNPAVSALASRMKEVFVGRCLPRPLDPVSQKDVETGFAPPEELGRISCSVVEARSPGLEGTCAPCGGGRLDLQGSDAFQLASVAKQQLRNQGRCVDSGDAGLSCDDVCLCEIDQLRGDELLACLTQGTAMGLNGFCYVDPAAATESASDDGMISQAEQTLIEAQSSLVASCNATERRVLRFLGENLPSRDSVALLICPSQAAR